MRDVLNREVRMVYWERMEEYWGKWSMKRMGMRDEYMVKGY